MELENQDSGEQDLRNPNNGEPFDFDQNQCLSEEIDSSCSTPYVSAPSSPVRVPNSYFFSAPASPMHFIFSSSSSSTSAASAFISSSSSDISVSGSFEFEFSARFPSNASTVAGSMISADELFLNGQIRPMKLSSHLQRPQVLAPLLDLGVEDEDEGGGDDFEKCEESLMRGRSLRLRNRSLRRRARSLSPRRNVFQWHEDEEAHDVQEISGRDLDLEGLDREHTEMPSTETTPSVSASSSRSSSSGRSSKRWIFLKDFLYRSKSEGGGNGKEKFWYSISFSPGKDKKSPSTSPSLTSSKEKKPPSSTATTEPQKPKRTKRVPAKNTVAGKPVNGVGKRRNPPSPHELHYKTNRAQAEEMRKKTFLPYRQGLLGCLGFSSKSYGAINGFARTLNPLSSR